MEFEEARKQIGSGREIIKAELYQNKQIYLVSAISALAVGVLVFSFNFFKDPFVLFVIILNIGLFTMVSLLTKKSYIKQTPNEKQIIEEFNKANRLKDFKKYLESMVSITDIVQNIPTRAFDVWLFSFGFSNMYAFILYFIDGIFSEAQIVVYGLLIYAVTSLFYWAWKFYSANDFEITKRALIAVDKYGKG